MQKIIYDEEKDILLKYNTKSQGTELIFDYVRGDGVKINVYKTKNQRWFKTMDGNVIKKLIPIKVKEVVDILTDAKREDLIEKAIHDSVYDA
jgi:hypothetical protein